MNKRIITIGTIGIIGLSVWFYTAPMRAMSEIKKGFENKNADLVSSHIDYTALRGSIKEQMLLRTALKSEDKSNGFKLGQAMGASMLDNMLQSYFTPSGLKLLLERDEKGFLGKNLTYSGSFVNVDTYSVKLDNGDSEPLNATLKRTGLFEWKVVYLDMPSNESSKNKDLSMLDAKSKITCVNMKGTYNALRMFKLDKGRYPTDDEGLEPLLLLDYIGDYPLDGWGNELLYINNKDGVDIMASDEANNISFVDCGLK